MAKFDALESLKESLSTMTDTQIIQLIKGFVAGRMEGPKKVERSEKTGAPTTSRVKNPTVKFNELMRSLPPDEREKLIKSLLPGEN